MNMDNCVIARILENFLPPENAEPPIRASH